MLLPAIAVGIVAWGPAGASSDSGAPRLAYEVVTIKNIELDRYSRMGRQAVKKHAGLIGRSDHFIVFAGDLRELSAMVDEAEFAVRRIERWFDLPPSTSTPSLLVAVKDAKVWRKLTREHGLRQDGLAMQINRELYLKDDAEQKKRPDRIAHEVVHLRLSEAFGDKVPLWLDEGLAGHYGWLCAAEYQGRQGVNVFRNQPALEESQLLSLQDLLNIRRYPVDQEKARAFYRQSEDLAGVLADRLGVEGMARFVRDMMQPGENPLMTLRRAAGLDEKQEVDIIEAMRARSLSVRKP